MNETKAEEKVASQGLPGPQCQAHQDRPNGDNVRTHVCQLVEGHKGAHVFTD
jgi:hypothetical protein